MNGAVQQMDTKHSEKGACRFAGHLRVRPAASAEAKELAGLFADPGRGRWAAETLAGGRARSLVIERFAGATWRALGFTVTAADGETALALHVGERGRGMAHEALRAALRGLREEPFTELSAIIETDDARTAAVFEKAGFAPAGSCRFRGRTSTRFVRNLRGDCTPYNVWI